MVKYEHPEVKRAHESCVTSEDTDDELVAAADDDEDDEESSAEANKQDEEEKPSVEVLGSKVPYQVVNDSLYLEKKTVFQQLFTLASRPGYPSRHGYRYQIKHNELINYLYYSISLFLACNKYHTRVGEYFRYSLIS